MFDDGRSRAAIVVFGNGMTRNITLERLLADQKSDELWRYLENESHLPGPRANVELITQFVAGCSSNRSAALRSDLEQWLKTPLIDAPVNSAAEYPVACAAAGLAAWIVDDPELTASTLSLAAHDSRWRTREAVTIGLQQVGREQPEPILDLVQVWGGSGDAYLERAALVTLADTPLLRNPGAAQLGLTLVDRILDRLQGLPQAQQKTEGNQILNKALAFTISLFVAASPEAGFA